MRILNGQGGRPPRAGAGKGQKANLGVMVFFSCLLPLASCLFPSLAFPANMRIEAMGSVAVYENIADADRLSVEDAFRKAVAKVTESIIPAGQLDALIPVLDEKIYGNANRYILNYRLISKETMEDEFSVAEGGVSIYNAYIEADIDVGLLTKDLISAGIIREGEVKIVPITILNLESYRGFELFKNNVAKARGVKNIRYNSFARGKIELIVETTEGAQALQQEIAAMDMKEWKIEAALIPDGRITVRFFPQQMR